MKWKSRSLIAGRRSLPSEAPSPPLTSMVDMMTILVVFLLVSFSVEGEIFTPARDVRLPVSDSRARAVPELSVEVSAAGIRVDGTPVVSLTEAMAGDDLMIAPLEKALASRLRAETAEGAEGQPSSLPPLVIQCDREVEFRVLKRVVHTCSQAGGSDFALLVRVEEP